MFQPDLQGQNTLKTEKSQKNTSNVPDFAASFGEQT